MSYYNSEKEISRGDIGFAVNNLLYKFASSLFLENKSYETKEMILVDYIKRDLYKLEYLKENTIFFIDSLLYKSHIYNELK